MALLPLPPPNINNNIDDDINLAGGGVAFASYGGHMTANFSNNAIVLNSAVAGGGLLVGDVGLTPPSQSQRGIRIPQNFEGRTMSWCLA